MDVDLIRRLLFILEESPGRRIVDDGEHGLDHGIDVGGYDEDVVGYHVRLLMESPWTSRRLDDGDSLLSLSFAGHELVELMRPDHIWAVAKGDVFRKTGGHNLGLIEGRLKP